MELLKTANALLGFNQASLSKYLLIAAKEDVERSPIRSGMTDPEKSLVNDVPAFFAHVLERVHFDRDLHFQTATTIDTLDYTGTSLNHGSKVVIAATGAKCRELRNNPDDLKSLTLPEGFKRASIAMKGILLLEGPAFTIAENATENFSAIDDLKASLGRWAFRENYPWVSVIDEGALDTNNILNDFLWLTFTRSDPAQDIYGLDETVSDKHWKCNAPLIIDARVKPHHQETLTVSDDIKTKAKQILKEAGVQ